MLVFHLLNTEADATKTPHTRTPIAHCGHNKRRSVPFFALFLLVSLYKLFTTEEADESVASNSPGSLLHSEHTDFKFDLSSFTYLQQTGNYIYQLLQQ